MICKETVNEVGATAGFSSRLAQQVAPEPRHAGCVGRPAGQIGRQIGVPDGGQDNQSKRDLSQAA